ncbi:hypothetical protein GCM10011343_23420 [Flavobacterium orientale]|uniref:Heavy metal binding domain-containing protein n=2 Tax=Flavobacterium orientale TaxID=1756020 RepID=A0A916Y6S0_9FLAO|nr:hypothetical protein GCM10011343_23420 [Flavobacterium orientale]
MACNQKNNDENQGVVLLESDTTSVNSSAETQETKEMAYACPMHPEVNGNSGETCPKCGMDLTAVLE